MKTSKYLPYFLVLSFGLISISPLIPQGKKGKPEPENKTEKEVKNKEPKSKGKTDKEDGKTEDKQKSP